MRDGQLDIYRALLMLYIPCVIHVMYWLGDGSEPFMSLLLVEMPLIFFVAGASLSVSRSRRGLLETVINRFKRVVVPYYIYAAVLLCLGIIATTAFKAMGQSHLFALDLSQYGIKDVASILLCHDIPQFPFIWHLWFIPIYLILSCTFPLQVRLMEKTGKWIYITACALLFCATLFFKDFALVKQVLCYNIFMVAGYLFYKKTKPATTALTGAIALAIVLVGVFIAGVPFCPMQGHKFPPDWLFVAYNVFVLCLIALAVGRITLRGNRFLGIWSERGYNIYLYQSVVFAIVHLVRQKTYADIPAPLVRATLDACLILVLSTGLSYVTYPLERIVMKKMRLK